MNFAPIRQKIGNATWTLLGVLCLGASGCGSDSMKSATISVRGNQGVEPAPSPTPYSFRAGNRVDTDSQAGNEDGFVHQTSSGLTVTNVSIGGNNQRTDASSANFKVSGGIYAE